jgi:pimeloyl-ACP methyl ester carboxylesterase
LSAGYKVIILDQRGNGKSDKPHHPEAYSNDAESRDIMGLMKHIHVKKYNVVGYSRGSIITVRLLALDKNVKRAVLGGIGMGFTDPEWPRRKMFYRALMGDSVPELAAMVKCSDLRVNQQALAYSKKNSHPPAKNNH